MIPASKLKNFNLLVVDGDIQLGRVLKTMLEKMGFGNVQATPNGAQALDVLRKTPIDFMVTEWNTRELDGLELLNRIRRDNTTPDIALPIIMLTGRGEKEDVITARDYGINEYVIKPFTAKTVYSRLERLIESPRNFVLSQYYVGPDRRNKNTLLPKGVTERRQSTLKAVAKAGDSVNSGLPKMWLPDYSLKMKLGRETALSSVITPTMIADAQQTIEAATADSMNWLQENLVQLKALQQRMLDGDFYTLLPIDMSETALTMSSRSGTFGYNSASKVAYLLYLFCRNHLRVDEPAHHLVAEKHIDALRYTLNSPQRDKTTSVDHEIICELRNLIEKYAA